MRHGLDGRRRSANAELWRPCRSDVTKGTGRSREPHPTGRAPTVPSSPYRCSCNSFSNFLTLGATTSRQYPWSGFFAK